MPNMLVQPPIAGVVRRFSPQLQPPYSTFSSVNWWPLEPKSGRIVTSTRPPFVQLQQPVTSDPFRLMAQLNIPEPTLFTVTGTSMYKYQEGWQPVIGSVPADDVLTAAPFLRRLLIATGGALLDYDSQDNLIQPLVANFGTVPFALRVIATWAGSLWGSGSEVEGENVLFVSRTGNVFDWDYDQADSGGAFSTQGDNEGYLNTPVTALMPTDADAMFVAGEDELNVMRGHPRRGGVFDRVDDHFGVLGPYAWDTGPGDILYFMSKAGLVTLAPQLGAIPTLVSPEKIPDDLVGLPFDRRNPNVNVVYDPRWNFVYITIRGANPQAWLFDLTNGGFFEMTLPDYPITAVQFDPFETNDTSGVVFGGDSLRSFDVRGQETLPVVPRQFVGPFLLSETPANKSIILEADVVTSSGTFASADGEIALYCAETGQRAADYAVADSGPASFRVTRNQMLNNGGKFRPMVAGAAAVLKLEGSTELANQLVFDQAALNIEPRGPIRITVREAPQAFPTPVSGYVQTTPAAPNSTLNNFSNFVNMARFPKSWWDTVKADGGDVRVSNTSNTELPFDLVEFDKTARTGFLVYLRSLSATNPLPVRVWAGNATAVLPNPSDPTGQFNAYDSAWLAFYPQGGGDDRTSNGLDLTMTGSPVVGGAIGPIGNTGTAYNGTTQFGQSIGGFSANLSISLTGWFNCVDVSGSNPVTHGVNFTNNGVTNLLNNSLRMRALNGRQLSADSFSSGGVGASAVTSNQYDFGAWSHGGVRFISSTNRLAILHGSTGTAGQNTDSNSINNVDSIIVGARTQLTPAAEFFNGSLSLLGVHTVNRSFEFIRFQRFMMFQFSAFGSWNFTEAAWPF